MGKNKKFCKSFIGLTCQVHWFDASGEMKEQLSELKHIEPSSLLIPTTTYGVIYKVDDGALIILQEQSDTECDFTCIPISWIEEIKELK